MTDAQPNRIRALREALNQRVPGEYTQAALARRLVVDPDTLRSWENGSRRPQGQNARRLARVLGVRVEELWPPPDAGAPGAEETGAPPGGAAPD